MARYFTLEEATALIPSVERDLRQALRLRGELAAVRTDLQQWTQRVSMLGGVQVDQTKVLGMRGRHDAITRRLQEILEEIQGYGCQVKDLEMGLLDFPTLYHGREVLLCWKLGETAITWWHGLDEGFGGRKPIDEEFLSNHRGGE